MPRPPATGPPRRLVGALRAAARYGGFRALDGPFVAGTNAPPGVAPYRLGYARALVRAGYATLGRDGTYALTPTGVITAITLGIPIGDTGALPAGLG